MNNYCIKCPRSPVLGWWSCIVSRAAGHRTAERPFTGHGTAQRVHYASTGRHTAGAGCWAADDLHTSWGIHATGSGIAADGVDCVW